MYCPECGAEYREGYEQCSDCRVALVPEPPENAEEIANWVIVHESSESDVIPVLKSLFRSAGIPFQTRGEGMLNLFPSEALGPILTRHSAEVQLVVPPDRAQEARDLLAAEFEQTDEIRGTAED